MFVMGFPFCAVVPLLAEDREPYKETLQRMVNEIPVTPIAKEFEVSDTAVARVCKKHGIVKPDHGDLAKTKATKGRPEARQERKNDPNNYGMRCAAFLELRREGQ